jgi:uncharacterized protein
MALSRAHDPRRLDVAAFAAAAGELEGSWPADRFARLLSVTAAPPDGAAGADVAWRVRGEHRVLPGAGVRPSIEIGAETVVTLECQRCLQPMRVPVQVSRRVFFVDGEDAAAALDAESEDDVLALVPALDLGALIEDELLLGLPLVPRHVACPEPLARAFVDEAAEPDPADNPFAVLAALKRGAPPS